MEVEKAEEENELQEKIIDEPKPDDTKDKTREKKTDGKLIVAEEIEEGHVSFKALNLYFEALGGVIFWIVFLGGMFGAEYVGLTSNASVLMSFPASSTYCRRTGSDIGRSSTRA